MVKAIVCLSIIYLKYLLFIRFTFVYHSLGPIGQMFLSLEDVLTSIPQVATRGCKCTIHPWH